MADTGDMAGPQRIRIDGAGITLTADAWGDPTAPPVVLLHGGGQTRHAWGGAGTVFARAGYRSVSVDLRGHSDSDWSPDGDYDLQRFADDVIAVARSFGRPPALVGASLGGLASMLALATVAEDPAETADGRHHVGSGDDHVEVVKALFDFCREFIGADDVGPRCFGVTGLVALGEDRNLDVLAEPVGQGEGAAELLLGVPYIYAQPDMQFD